jgi:hypothetical protein
MLLDVVSAKRSRTQQRLNSYSASASTHCYCYPCTTANTTATTDVGDILQFDSCVLMTREGEDGGEPRASIEVLAHVLRPEAVQTKLSNRFNFTFSYPELAAPLRKVLPGNMSEARRVVVAMERDAAQKQEDDGLGSKPDDDDVAQL